MKPYKIYLFVLFLVSLSFSSCEEYFGDINVDPDNPIEVTPNVLLPQIEVRLAYVLGGDASRYVGVYTQHVDGVSRQWTVIGAYGIQPVDVDNMWNQMLYSGVLMDNRQLQRIAEENGYNHYVGIGKAIEAYTMMLVTDLWGDVPYSTAFQGTEVIQPTFDSQESIYNAIFALINEARGLLDADAGGFSPGRDDLIYGGDISLWKKFLNVLEARAHLHLADMDAGKYQQVLTALDRGGFDSRDDEARVDFGNGSTESAPWFQFIEQRDDIDIGSNYVNLMESLNDPRVDIYGAEMSQGVPHPILTRDRSLPLLSYTEQLFMRAEALLQTSGPAAAHPVYLDAIESSFMDAGAEGYAAYITQPEVDPGADNLGLEEIITQKYIALFLDPEVFNDWRRTNIPALKPNVGQQVPRRLPYAENEILSNTNTPSPADVTIFTKVWWDQ